MLSSEVQKGSSDEGGGVDVNTQVVLLYRERDESRNRLKRPPWLLSLDISGYVYVCESGLGWKKEKEKERDSGIIYQASRRRLGARKPGPRHARFGTPTAALGRLGLGLSSAQ